MASARRHLTAVAVVCALTSVPATASPGPAPGAELDRARVLATIAGTGDAASVLRAALSAVDLPSASREPPEPVNGALAVLRSSMDTAERLRVRALAALSPEDRARILAGASASAPAAFPAVDGARTILSAGSDGIGLALDPTATSALARVDETALRAAALAVLDGIARAAPLLGAVRGSGGDGGCGVTGDVVFAAEDCSVVIGGQGATTYPSAVAPKLVVDLGGNDRYFGDVAAAVEDVRLVLDLAGDDRYERSRTRTDAHANPHELATQGVGVLGVGVLADLAGNDTYSATATAIAPQPGPIARPVQLVAQGAAIGGAGILLDVGGNNSFSAVASSSGGDILSIVQGASRTGLGALLALGPNSGGAGDRHVARATSALHQVKRTALVQAFTIGDVDLYGQGAGLSGAGVVVEASGHDEYEVASAGGTAKTTAHGAARAGAGVLVDAAGTDQMVATATGDTELSFISTDASLCYDVAVSVQTGSTEAVAQGAALGGTALLVDAAGADERVARAHSRASAIVEVTSGFNCFSFGGNRATATAKSGPGIVYGQGAVTSGSAALVDLDGDDANVLEGTSTASARAIAMSPGLDFETPSATPGTGAALGQGQAFTGVGIAADATGEDSYTTAATKTATATNSAGTASSVTRGQQQVQGWASSGLGLFLDAGGDDAYSDPGAASRARDDSCWSHSDGGFGADVRAGTVPACP